MKNSISKQFKEGIVTSNPVFVQLLGMCPALAITTSVINAVGMGVTLTAVLVLSNLFISLISPIIPKQIRILSYIAVIAGFVTAAELLMEAFYPALCASLGLFVPLMAVNSVILSRVDMFASANKPIPSIIDGVATGIGFTLSLICVAFARELVGTGSILAAADGSGGIRVLGDLYPGAPIFLLPAGAFLTLGFIIAAYQKIRSAVEQKKAKAVDAEGGTENE